MVGWILIFGFRVIDKNRIDLGLKDDSVESCLHIMIVQLSKGYKPKFSTENLIKEHISKVKFETFEI